jgi:ankyrin repeat protein
LTIAAAHGNQESVKLLTQAGATSAKQVEPAAVNRYYESTHWRVEEEWSPLAKAAYLGQTDQVQSLLAAGANPNGTTNLLGEKLSLVELALLSQNQETIRALLSASPSVSSSVFERFASGTGDAFVSEMLLEKGVEPSMTDYQVSAEANNLELLKLLNEHKPFSSFVRDSKEEVIEAAVKNGQISAAQFLLTELANADLRAEIASINLVRASMQGNLSMMQMLLDQGADPNFVYETPSLGLPHRTALQAAILSGFPDVIDLLRKAGATK